MGFDRSGGVEMGDSVQAFLEGWFREELDGGFPLLSKVPQTGIIRLIDYLDGLSGAARDTFIAALASRAEAMLIPGGGMLPRPEAYERFYAAQMLGSGPRYLSLKLQGLAPPLRVSGLAATVRADLLPDPANAVVAKAPLLRSLVKEVLTPLGFVAHKTAGGGVQYLKGDGTLVDLDFGARAVQLRYSVAVGAAEKAGQPLTGVRGGSFEALIGGGLEAAWDCLTEENAARSIAHLPAMIDAATNLLLTF